MTAKGTLYGDAARRRGTGPSASAALDAVSGRSGVRSEELEKLLNSWGALPTRTQSYSSSSQGRDNPTTQHSGTSKGSSDSYDAEAMIDELLASTWEPVPVRKASIQASAGGSGGMTSQAKTASFLQQTRAMNELQNVLAESIERLIKHRQVISDRITSLEKDNQKESSKFQDGLKNPEQLLNVSFTRSCCRPTHLLLLTGRCSAIAGKTTCFSKSVCKWKIWRSGLRK